MSELGCALPHYETTVLRAVQAHVLLLSLHDESNCSLFIFGIGEDKDNIIFFNVFQLGATWLWMLA